MVEKAQLARLTSQCVLCAPSWEKVSLVSSLMLPQKCVSAPMWANQGITMGNVSSLYLQCKGEGPCIKKTVHVIRLLIFICIVITVIIFININK